MSDRTRLNVDRSEDQPAQFSQLIDEIKALRDASEELFILLEHIWQNREDLRFQVSVVTNDNGREALAESICCYECDADAPCSLAQSLHDGWIDISLAEAEHGVNYVGWCPACQLKNGQWSQEHNPGPLDLHADEETLFDQQSSQNEVHKTEQSSATREKPRYEATNASSPAMHDLPHETNEESPEDAARPTASDRPTIMPSTTESFSYLPTEEYRQKTPLLTRMYLHRHMTDIVRVIGYDIVSREVAKERIQPLIERYGREIVEPAVSELLDVRAAGSEALVRLKDEVRQLARGLLGPPPAPSSTEQTIASNQRIDEAPPPIESGTRCSARKKTDSNRETVSKLGALRPVRFSRKEMLLEFREHLQKQETPFEEIDDATRAKYTDKYLGALDFILRAPGEPPELIAVRRKVTTTQLHDLKQWQAIVGQEAGVSIVWLYTDTTGQTSWEICAVEDDDEPSATTDDATG